jgi:1,4-dihydroxy-2-naphthoate polyprenyltransferase
MATLKQWMLGARPWTLPAAVAPVAAGTGAAAALGGAHALRGALALLVSLALQIGVNYANDYSDGIRGTDRDRVGPLRLTGSGAARPSRVRAAAFAAFGVAMAAGLVLVALCHGWWLVGLGAACVLAAWYYTGGRRPYGYRGLGEVFVFIFFGLVAVLGTTFVQAGRLSLAAGLAAVGVGALACAILVANNLRDLPRDAEAGKRTLAVRMGDRSTRCFFTILQATAWIVLVPILPSRPWVAVTFLALPASMGLCRRTLAGAAGADLVPVLKRTGWLELAYGVLLGTSLACGMP